MTRAPSDKPTGEYRQYLPDLSLKRFQVMRTQDAHEYAHDFKTIHNPPWLHALYMHWLDLLQEPFKGVTTDGMIDVFFSTIAVLLLISDQEMSDLDYSHYKMKTFPSAKS